MSAARAPMSAVLTLPVVPGSGIRCAGCVSRACAQMESLPGVIRVDCDPRGTVRVDYDAQRTSHAQLEAAASRLGAEVSASFMHAVWRVTGLD